MKRLTNFLFSHAVMAILMIVLAVVMGMATFYENKYGTITAKYLFYNSVWFETLWIALTINMLGATFKNKLYTKEKFSILVFHLAFVIMILGAGVTRYFGFEGNISIREGQTENKLLTSSTFFTIKTSGDIIAAHINKLVEQLASNGEKISNFSLNIIFLEFFRIIPNINSDIGH